MAKVNLTRTYRYAFDGIRVVEYAPGVVDVPEEVAETMVKDGAATRIEDPPPRKATKPRKRSRKAAK